MNAADFLNEINEKSWRNNTKYEISKSLEKLIEFLQSHEKEIVENVADNLVRIEEVKNESEELFGYEDFNKWVEYYLKETIKDIL